MIATPKGNGQNGRSLPEGWEWRILAHCVDILDGRRVPINNDERERRIAGKEQDELYPYYGATGHVGWIDDYIFNEEIVLLGEDGAPFLEPTKNKAYIVRGKSWVNNHAHVLRAKNGVTTNPFLMHYLNCFDYHDYVTGTTRLKLNQGRMRVFPIALPPLPEQERIVSRIEELFSDLGAGVAALERVRAGLKRYKASVLKAVCEGELFGDKISDGSRELPVGWRWVKLTSVLSEPLSNGKSTQTANVGFPVLRLTALKNGRIDLQEYKIGDWTEERAKKYQVRLGDFFVSRGNGSLHLVGRGGLVEQEPGGVAYPDTLIRIRIVPDICDIKYVRAIWDSTLIRSQIETTARTTAGIYKINQKDLCNFTFPLPPLDEQRRIVPEVERRLSVVQEVESAVEAGLMRAGRLRQSVLKSAFEGRL